MGLDLEIGAGRRALDHAVRGPQRQAGHGVGQRKARTRRARELAAALARPAARSRPRGLGAAPGGTSSGGRHSSLQDRTDNAGQHARRSLAMITAGPLRPSGVRQGFVSLSVLRQHRPARADIAHTSGRRNRRAIHKPNGQVAAAVLPKDVTLAVTVIVAGLGDAPSAAGRHNSDTQGGLDLPVFVHEPDRYGPRVAVPPQNVGVAITIEISNALKHPVIRDRADADG